MCCHIRHHFQTWNKTLGQSLINFRNTFGQILNKFFIQCFMKGTIELGEDLAFIFCKVSVMKSAAFVKN